MLKKIFGNCLLAGIFCFMVTAGCLAVEKKDGITYMTLNETIEYAGEHNKTLIDLKDSCENIEDTYESVKTRTIKIQNIPDKVNFSSMEEYALFQGYTLEKTKYTYEELLKLKELTEQITYYNIEKLVLEVDETQKDIEYLKKTKQKLEKDFAIAKLMLKLKMANQNQVNQVQTAVKQMDSKIKLLSDILIIKKNAVKALIGIDRNVTLKISLDKKEFKAIGEIDIQEFKKQAGEKRQDAIILTNVLNSKKMDYELYDRYKKYIRFKDYTDKMDAYNKEKDRYENSINDIKQKVINAYEALITSEKDYNDALERYNNTAETHRINKIKYSMGMISLIDFMESELGLANAEIDVEKALNKNILVNRKFTVAYEIGDIE